VNVGAEPHPAIAVGDGDGDVNGNGDGEGFVDAAGEGDDGFGDADGDADTPGLRKRESVTSLGVTAAPPPAQPAASTRLARRNRK